MKREKFNKLFEMGWEENPKNGKPKRVARYIGKYYRVELAARDRGRPWLIAEGVAALALFQVGGLVNNLGSHCAWVVPFYAVTALPVFYFLLGVGRLCNLRWSCFGCGRLPRKQYLPSAWFTGLPAFLRKPPRLGLEELQGRGQYGSRAENARLDARLSDLRTAGNRIVHLCIRNL